VLNNTTAVKSNNGTEEFRRRNLNTIVRVRQSKGKERRKSKSLPVPCTVGEESYNSGLAKTEKENKQAKNRLFIYKVTS